MFVATPRVSRDGAVPREAGSIPVSVFLLKLRT
jgi:hypothetical protein